MACLVACSNEFHDKIIILIRKENRDETER